MAEASKCWGHKERKARKNKIQNLVNSSMQSVDENFKVLINKGPVSKETSLKEIEEVYTSRANWKKVEHGGVLSIPLGEFRMMDPPQPDRKTGQFDFGKGGKETKIENYTVGQTVENLNALLLDKYNEEKEKTSAAGMSEVESMKAAATKAFHLPLFKAVKAWQDIEAEIKLKMALEVMMDGRKIPALVIRSVSLKAISALKNLGLKIPDGNGEIDMILAYVSGDFLHVEVFEVKRADTYPWETKNIPLNKQAVDKAEKQLTKDLDILMAILAGIPPSQIVFHTFACFPDASSAELQAFLCRDCLENNVVCKEDLADLCLLQKKTQVPNELETATSTVMGYLLTFIARCLSYHSLLHIGYREVEDKEKLITERHRYNLESVDGKMMQKEFVVASPQQQKVISSFTASLTMSHLVLEGPAGTGKTLMALQVANSIMESLTNACDEEADNEPLLVVTADFVGRDNPLMKYLDTSTGMRANKVFNCWTDILIEYGVNDSKLDSKLLHLTKALAKTWKGRPIVMLVDEICNKELLEKLEEQDLPQSVRMILVMNPDPVVEIPLTLPPNFLHVTLTTSYRSTIAITRLAQFIAKCKGLDVPEGDLGSDIEGTKPIFFDVGKDERKMQEAVVYSQKYLGDNATILYDWNVPGSILKMVLQQGKKEAGLWDCCHAGSYYGWEAERVAVVTDGFSIMELITRARTNLSLFLVEGTDYAKTKEYFQQAADLGLVEVIQLSAEEAVEIDQGVDETKVTKGGGAQMGDSDDSVADLWAALKSHAQLKQLLEGGADVNVATKQDGWSLLHDAAYVKGNLRIVKLLLQHMADVNAK